MKLLKGKFVIIFVLMLFSSILYIALVFGQTNKNAQFTGNEEHQISLEQAIKMIQNYRNNPTVPDIKGGYFGRNIFDKLLSQDSCVGIRYYYAKTDSGSATIVLVGVNKQGLNMSNGVIGEIVFPCPPLCDGPSPLN